MKTLQYFVFDETGNHILEAGGSVCETEEEAKAKADTIVSIFKDYRYSVYCGSDLIAERR